MEEAIKLVESIIIHAEDERTNRSWDEDNVGWENIDRIWDAAQRIKTILIAHKGAMIMEKDCFTCVNSFVDDDDKLHCMADGHDHEQTVDDNHVCDDWKR